MRWAVFFGLAFPVLILAALLAAKFGGNGELATRWLRLFRYVVAAEFLGILALALIGYRYERRERQREALLHHPPGRLIPARSGLRVHLYCTGSGSRTVVLTHGLHGSYLDWQVVQRELSGFARVCSWDRPGYGWSDRSVTQRIPSVMAEELRSVLQVSGEPAPYILVGHSFGSLIAEAFAHRFPDETAGLVLVDGADPEALRMNLRYALWLRTLQFTMPFGLPRWRRWCGRTGPDPDLERALKCRSEFYRTIYRELQSQPETAAEMNAITDLDGIPLVVIARDPAASGNSEGEARNQERQRKALALSRQSRFVLAPGSRHNIPAARPDVIVEAVRSLMTARAEAGSRGTP